MSANLEGSSVIPLLWMVFALGLDGFSVSLSIGMQNIRLKRMLLIAVIMGTGHFILPIIGMLIGNFISFKLDVVTGYASGLLLVFIGAYMFFSAFHSSEKPTLYPFHMVRIFTLTFIVSVDSFPVGLSIGLLGMKSIFIVFLIGMSAMMFSLFGMIIGRHAHRTLGVYSEMLGGIILFLYGLKALF